MTVHPSLRLASCFVGIAVLSTPAGAADAPEHVRTAAELLPATTAMYAEVPDPGRLIDLVLDHPIHDRLRQMDDYQKAFATPQYQQFLLGVKIFEGAVEMRWRPALKLLTEGGVYLALDGETDGAVLLVKSGDAEKLAALREAVFTVIRADAQQKGNADAIKTAEYRGIAAHRAGPARIAIAGEWLIVTNKDELGKAVLDRYLNDGAASLSEAPQYQTARASRPDGAAAWAYADLHSLREKGLDRQLSGANRDNPLGELLLGGVTAAANRAPFAAAALEAEVEGLALSAAVPFDPSTIGEERAYYFGSEGQGAAPPLPTAGEAIFTLSTYRDLSEFWAWAPELFSENIDAKFAEANNGLTTLFSGRDFGDEVLGAVEPEVQLIVARQQFPQAELPAPDIKLPAFAAVFRLRDAEKMRRPMKVSLQSLIGFLNVVGAMNGQPQFEQLSEARDGAEILSARYLPPVDEEDRQRGLINYNFSPTAVFDGDLFIVSSAKALAEELAESARPAAAEAPTQTNTHARLNAESLRAILSDNREQLLAQNMLEKGHSREEAEKEIGALLELLTWLQNTTIRLHRDDQTLRLKWDVTLAKTPTPSP